MRKNFKLLLLTVPLLLGCLSLSNPPALAVSHPNPYGNATIDPAPPHSTILKLSKGAKYVNLSLEQLKSMKSSTLTIYEPFVKKKQSFRVILLSDLFKLVGIVGRDKVATIALNDYRYTNTATNFVSAVGYLALARDGFDIPYNQGGPIRILYPAKSKWHDFFDAWNWSLMEITVK